MRRRFIYDRELDAMIEITTGSNRETESPHGIQIIRDIEPYRTAASDVTHDGKRVMIGSRSRHREFLSDNGYREVGNENLGMESRPTLTRDERVNDIRRAMGDFGSNTGSRG